MSEQILLAILGSGCVSAAIASATTLLVRYLDRKNSRNDKIDEIEKKVNRNELDNVRLQMMILMSDYPDEKQEIMRVAEHYFHDLGGNWYMTTMFNNWLEQNEIAKPEWFNNYNN